MSLIFVLNLCGKCIFNFFEVYLFFILCVCVICLHVYLCMQCLWRLNKMLDPPFNCSYRRLWATYHVVLDIQWGSSERAISALNFWAISPAQASPNFSAEGKRHMTLFSGLKSQKPYSSTKKIILDTTSTLHRWDTSWTCKSKQKLYNVSGGQVSTW